MDNGVKAIWNFAHTDLNLKLPKDVIVENVHLSESLMRLSYNLTRYERSIQRTIMKPKQKQESLGKPETFSVHFPDKAGKGGKAMKRILTAAQMKQADRNTIETMGVPVPGTDGARSAVLRGGASKWNMGYRKVLLLHSGNNGGDGAAIARILKTKGVDAELFCLGNPEKYSEGMRAQKKIAENYANLWRLDRISGEYFVIIDAIFGIGVSRPLAGEYRRQWKQSAQAVFLFLPWTSLRGSNTDTGRSVMRR